MHWWNRFEQFFKRRGLALLEKWLAVEALAPSRVELAAIRRILVIRQHDYLGDFLLATPVLRALREHFPQAHLGALVRRYTAEVARHNQYLDEVLVFEEHGWNWTPARFWRLWRQLRQGWDLAIVLTTVSHSLTSDVMARLSRARYCLGSEERVFPGCSRNFFYHLSAPSAGEQRHQTDRNLDIVRMLGIDTADHSEVMTLTPADRAFAADFLAQHEISPTDRVVALHLGAGKRDNRWPPENFAALANALHREYRVRVLAAWGPQETELGAAFLRQLSFSPTVVTNVALRQLAALLAAADGYVCNDTGVMHAGAAVGVPLVAIFGPTDPTFWKPKGEKFIALRGHSGECANVGPEQVLQALLRLVSPPLPVRHEYRATPAQS